MDFIKNRTGDPHINDWNTDLANHFVGKAGRWWPVARAVAKALYEADPKNPYRLTACSSVLRSTGRPAEAMALLREKGEPFRSDRSLLYEWGTVAGAVGDQGLGTWLDGRSLADGGTLEARQCKLSLAGLGVAFRTLFAASEDRGYATAQAACGQLGLGLPDLDATARGYFEKYLADGQRHRVGTLTPKAAVEAIRKAVIRGAMEVLPDHDQVFFERLLGEPEGYRYTALPSLVDPAKGAAPGAAKPKTATRSSKPRRE